MSMSMSMSTRQKVMVVMPLVYSGPKSYAEVWYKVVECPEDVGDNPGKRPWDKTSA
jgi:hypothetical protein